jgi:hypothetical protein
MVSKGGNENLCFMLKTPKSFTVDDSVSVTLEGSTHWTGLFWSKPTAGKFTFCGIGRETFFPFFTYLPNIKLPDHKVLVSFLEG